MSKVLWRANNVKKCIDSESYLFDITIDELKNRIIDAITAIEKVICGSVTSVITCDEKSLIINNRYFYHFVEHHCNGREYFKIKGLKNITLPCIFNNFTLKNPHLSHITIFFDDDFKIESLICESRNKDRLNNDVKIIFQGFNHLLQLNWLEYKFINVLTNIHTGFIRKDNALSSFEDESFFWKLFTHQIAENNELIPEFYVPSAYDFNSDDFKNRMTVYDMLCI
jgi:hypothetical protein